MSSDTDFGALLAFRRLTSLSFILLGSSDPLRLDQQAELMLASIETIAAELRVGAIVVFARGRLNTRRLPFQ